MPPFLGTFTRAIVSLTALCCFIAAGAAQAQGRSDSPVFRGYKASPSKQIPRNPDPEEQWRVMQLLREAGAGDRFSQHELGLRFLFGDGFQADTVKAAYWIGKAAAQQLVLANYNYGLLLSNGWGVPWNPFEAYRNIRFAAERGQVEAQHVFGLMYTENLVVQRDWNTALRWVRLAADSGHAPARAALPDLEDAARKYGIPASDTPASVYDTALAQSPSTSWSPIFLDFQPDHAAPLPDLKLLARDAVATSNLSAADSFVVMTMASASVADSTVRMVLSAASAAGNPEVIVFLAMCAQEGVAFERDPILAAAQYIRAVYLESPRAAVLLWSLIRVKGFFQVLQTRTAASDPVAMFVQSELVALDFDGRISREQALDMLVRSAELGNVQATIHLGICKYTGRWVTRNRDQALHLWTQAAGRGSKEAEIRVAAAMLHSDNSPGLETAATVVVLRAGDMHGSIIARVALASALETGMAIAMDKGAAARLYRSCAVRGSRSALRALRRMHDAVRPADSEFRVSSVEE